MPKSNWKKKKRNKEKKQTMNGQIRSPIKPTSLVEVFSSENGLDKPENTKFKRKTNKIYESIQGI